MSSLFTVSTQPACRIIVHGEVDAATAPHLESMIPRSGSVWLDFSGVTFLDSSGLSVLVAAHAAAKERGDHLHVSGLSGGPLRVVQMTLFWDILCAE